MPRLPVDGTKVIEHRITFGTKERQLLESYQEAYIVGNVGTLLDGLGIPEITKQFKDPTEMIGVFYSIAMVLEFLGIETGLPTPADFGTWYEEWQRKQEQMAVEREMRGGSTSVWAQFLDMWRATLGVKPRSGDGANGFTPESGPGSPGFQHPAYQDDQPSWSGTGIPDAGR